MTEPESLGPCEPGTAVKLQGIVWQETDKGKNRYIRCTKVKRKLWELLFYFMTKITTIVFMRGGQLLEIQVLKKSRMSRF